MAKGFRISSRVREKLLAKHGVSLDEVLECFFNCEGPAFEDSRLDHATEPPTMWFVAETDRRRLLKVVYVEYAEFFAFKSAFEAGDAARRLCQTLCDGCE